jgi:hypothetical protein
MCPCKAMKAYRGMEVKLHGLSWRKKSLSIEHEDIYVHNKSNYSLLKYP